MRKLRLAAVFAAIGMLCACAPIRPGIAQPVDSQKTMPSPVVTMNDHTSTPEQTPDIQIWASPVEALTAEATTEPTPKPTVDISPSASLKGFGGMVTSGLKERWEGSQAIVVRAESSTSPDAEMWLYERDGDVWKAVAGPWPAVVGKNGVTKHAEGEGKSPSGVFLLGTAFGWAAKPDGVQYQYTKLDASDRWVDDSSSPFYNSWVRGNKAVCGGGEDLQGTRQYIHAVVVHYNDETESDVGSAIFIHVWRAQGKGTQGCTAVSEDNMVSLLRWLDYSKRPVLVQGTEDEIKRLLTEDWKMSCLPQGWGFADDFIQDAQMEIRYNTDNNFTGHKLAGYHASLAPMRMEAITALVSAARELRGKKIGIRIYDAYRPQQGTDAMIAWAEDESDTATKKEYYPDIDKALIPGDYVARKSNHRLGGTVDLTLVDWRSGKNLDMGGPFDFFGEVSAFGYNGLTSNQAANRAMLRSVMVKYKFKPYDKEWWHFTFSVEGDGGTFPILPREYVVR